MEFDTAYAAAYEDERAGKPGWVAEEQAVSDWLTAGSVLDCPVGTGRFAPIYEARKLEWTGMDKSAAMLEVCRSRFPKAGLELGDILTMSTRRACGTLVCVRLLPWLSPPEMARALLTAGAVARRAIVSVRVGREGDRCRRGSLTHSWAKYSAGVKEAGLRIAETRVTADSETGQFLMTRLERT